MYTLLLIILVLLLIGALPTWPYAPAGDITPVVVSAYPYHRPCFRLDRPG